MLTLERHREILALLSEKGSARVTELAQRFEVTEETIRRDLDKLEADGQLARSHGGAVAVQSSERESPHWQREFLNPKEKEAIAREAVKLISENDVIILDASSTAWFVARRIPQVPLTVITNSMYSTLALAEHRDCKLISPGGTLTQVSMSFVGSDAQQTLRRYHARKSFLSCRGLDLERGACDISEEQAMMRRVMMEIADERILLVDSSKLGARALSVIAPVKQFSRIITDDQANPDFCRAVEERGVPVTRAQMY
jgi:DeoR/GlpR family transcriptional regulator of sugar metabolism